MDGRCGVVPSILGDVLLHGQDSGALEAAHTLLRTLTSDASYAKAMDSIRPLTEALNAMGFGGLWRSSTQGLMDGVKSECFDLTEKLIEVTSSYFSSLDYMTNA